MVAFKAACCSKTGATLTDNEFGKQEKNSGLHRRRRRPSRRVGSHRGRRWCRHKREQRFAGRCELA